MVGVDWNWVKRVGTVADALASAHIDERTLSAWLLDLVHAKGVDRMTAIRRARLNQTFGYQIFAGDRRASRDKLIQLAFGLELGVEGACELLERGGTNPLAPTCRRDVVIAFCLAHGLDVGACDDALWDVGEKTLMSPDA